MQKGSLTLALRAIALLYFSMTISLTTAQLYEHHVNVGVKGALQTMGIANQNNYGQKEMEYKVPVGLAIGVHAEYTLTDKASLLVEGCLQQQGQTYDDTFNGKHFYKKVQMRYLTFPVMYRHAIGKEGFGYQAVGTFWNPNWFAAGGLQFGTLLSAEIDWELNGQQTDFLTFVTDEGNPNEMALAENGVPEDDSDFFRKFDVVFVAAIGFHNSISERVALTAELRGGIGLTDINTPEWQLPNRQGEYGASRTTFLGLHIGVAARILSNRYN